MAGTKLYSEDILLYGNTSAYSSSLSSNKCVCPEDRELLSNVLFPNRGCVIGETDKDYNEYYPVDDPELSGVCGIIARRVLTGGTASTAIANTSHLLAGQEAKITFRIINPFKYNLTLSNAYMQGCWDGDPFAGGVQFLLTSSASCNANSQTSSDLTGSTFTVPYPVRYNNTRAASLKWRVRDANGQPCGTLLCSGNTDMKRNIPLFGHVQNTGATANTLTRVIIVRPYIQIERASGSGSVSAGTIVQITVNVYNPNGYRLSNGRLKVEVSGTGFSSGAGGVRSGTSGNFASSASRTSIVVTNTHDTKYITDNTKSGITFYYQAPSTTTQGVATISAIISGCTIDTLTGVSGGTSTTAPYGSGHTLQITVAGAQTNPQYYYYPFRVYGVNGTQYTGVDDLAGHIVNLSDNNATSCACWDDGGGYCGSQCVSAVVSSVTNGSSDRVYYARVATADTTTYFENLYITEFYEGSTNEGGSSEIYRTTGSTYAAFNSAGIASIYLTDTGVVVVDALEITYNDLSGYLEFFWLGETSEIVAGENTLRVYIKTIGSNQVIENTYTLNDYDETQFTLSNTRVVGGSDTPAEEIALSGLRSSGTKYISNIIIFDKWGGAMYTFGTGEIGDSKDYACDSSVNINADLTGSAYTRQQTSWYDYLCYSDVAAPK